MASVRVSVWLYRLSGVSGHGTAFTWPWGPDPHLCWPYHSPPPQEKPSSLQRTEALWALDPPLSAPLQHINSGTGTNCPTLDVLETQIASATNPQTLHPEHKKSFKRRIEKIAGLCARCFWLKTSSKRLHLRLCVTVNVQRFKACFQNIAPFLFPSIFLRRWHWFRFFYSPRVLARHHAIRRHFVDKTPHIR